MLDTTCWRSGRAAVVFAFGLRSEVRVFFVFLPSGYTHTVPAESSGLTHTILDRPRLFGKNNWTG